MPRTFLHLIAGGCLLAFCHGSTAQELAKPDPAPADKPPATAPAAEQQKPAPKPPAVAADVKLEALTVKKDEALREVAKISAASGQISEQDLAKLDDAARLVRARCETAFDYFVVQTKERVQFSLAMALVGAVSGAVIAPSILAGNGSKVAASMFSGLSGATNTAQTVVSEQGLTVEASRASHEQVRGAVQKALDDFVTAYMDVSKSAEERLIRMRGSLMKAENACFLRPH